MFSLLFLTLVAFCQDEKDFLKVEQADIFVEYNSGRSKGTSKEGVNLYIRKKAGVESVMLVETTTDPEKKEKKQKSRITQGLVQGILPDEDSDILTEKPCTEARQSMEEGTGKNQ